MHLKAPPKQRFVCKPRGLPAPFTASLSCISSSAALRMLIIALIHLSFFIQLWRLPGHLARDGIWVRIPSRFSIQLLFACQLLPDALDSRRCFLYKSRGIRTVSQRCLQLRNRLCHEIQERDLERTTSFLWGSEYRSFKQLERCAKCINSAAFAYTSNKIHSYYLVTFWITFSLMKSLFT